MSETNTDTTTATKSTEGKPVRIGFWIKESGNLMNKASGFTPEEIAFLRSLEVGDRLIGFNNSPKEAKYPTYNFTKYKGPSNGPKPHTQSDGF